MSGDMKVKGNAKSAEIQAEIIRADGTREVLGTVSYWHRNPLRRWLWRFRNSKKG